MDKDTFTGIIDGTFNEIRRLTATKGAEYSRSDDQLANFKRTGEDTSLHPVKVWQVFFNKHLDAIKHYTNRAGTPGSVIFGTSEPIEGRIDDAILYLILLKALIRDGSAINQQQIKPADKHMAVGVQAGQGVTAKSMSDTAVLMGRGIEERAKVDPRFEYDADRNKPFPGIRVDYSGTANRQDVDRA